MVRIRVSSFVKQMKEEGLTIAFAESITCGLITQKLGSCIGTSQVLKGTIVCYDAEVKRSLLGISKTMIEQYTCESEEVTEALAKKLSKLIDADIHAAITGLASEGGSESEEKPVGTVFFSVLYRNRIHNFRQLFRGTPLMIREKACHAMYELVLRVVRDQKQ